MRATYAPVKTLHSEYNKSQPEILAQILVLKLQLISHKLWSNVMYNIQDVMCDCKIRSVMCEGDVWCAMCDVWRWRVMCDVWRWRVTCYVWCVMCEVWSVMCDVLCVTCDVWHVTCDVWRVMCDVWRWCVMCDVWRVMCEGDVWCVMCYVWPVTCEGDVWRVTCEGDVWRGKCDVCRVTCKGDVLCVTCDVLHVCVTCYVWCVKVMCDALTCTVASDVEHWDRREGGELRRRERWGGRGGRGREGWSALCATHWKTLWRAGEGVRLGRRASHLSPSSSLERERERERERKRETRSVGIPCTYGTFRKKFAVLLPLHVLKTVWQFVFRSVLLSFSVPCYYRSPFLLPLAFKRYRLASIF